MSWRAWRCELHGGGEAPARIPASGSRRARRGTSPAGAEVEVVLAVDDAERAGGISRAPSPGGAEPGRDVHFISTPSRRPPVDDDHPVGRDRAREAPELSVLDVIVGHELTKLTLIWSVAKPVFIAPRSRTPYSPSLRARRGPPRRASRSVPRARTRAQPRTPDDRLDRSHAARSTASGQGGRRNRNHGEQRIRTPNGAQPGERRPWLCPPSPKSTQGGLPPEWHR